MPILLADLHRPKALRTKLKRRADPDGLVVCGRDGRLELPALHAACIIANVTTTKMLIEAGATLDLLNSNGNPAIMYAIVWQDDDCHDDKYRCMELLLSNGADVNISKPDGVTPLHSAMWGTGQREHPKPRAVELLLRFKADPTAETTDGHRPKCCPPSDSMELLHQADVDECTRLVNEALETSLEEKTVAAVSSCLVSFLVEHKQASKRTPRRCRRSKPLAITDQSDSAVGASSPAAVQNALTPQTAEEQRRNRRGLLQSTRPQESADDEPPAAPAAITAEAISAYQAALRQANKEIKRKKQAKRERAEAAATAAAMRAIL